MKPTKRFHTQLAALMLVAGMAASPLTAQHASPADRPIASVEVSGTVLTVTPHVAYTSAVLRVSGPGNYALVQRFMAGASIAVDLLANAEGPASILRPSPLGTQRGTRDRLPEGQFRYEIVFSVPEGERIRAGRFELGPSDRPDAETYRSMEVGTRPTAAKLGPIGGETTVVEDALHVMDVAGDGITTVFLDSDSAGLDWAINNSEGDLRFNAGGAGPRLAVNDGGEIGIGTTVPFARVHVTAAGPQLRLEDTLGNATFLSQNDAGLSIGRPAMLFSPVPLFISSDAPGGSLILENGGVGIGELSPEAALHVAGGGIIEGDVALGSSRTIKHAIESLDPVGVLAGVRELPLYSWKYRDDPDQAAHVGPMAEDVYEAFALGRDDKHLSPADTAGLALAAVQGVDRRLEAELQVLLQRLAALEARFGAATLESGSCMTSATADK